MSCKRQRTGSRSNPFAKRLARQKAVACGGSRVVRGLSYGGKLILVLQRAFPVPAALASCSNVFAHACAFVPLLLTGS